MKRYLQAGRLRAVKVIIAEAHACRDRNIKRIKQDV
jgi:hypothetical protein